MKNLTTMLLSLPLVMPAVAALEAPAQAPAVATLATPDAPALPFSASERDVLAAAERASTQELLELRGGDISNDTLLTILIVLGIIALVLIIV